MALELLGAAARDSRPRRDLRLGAYFLGVAVAEPVGATGPAARPGGGVPEGLASGVTGAEVVVLAGDGAAVANRDWATMAPVLEARGRLSGHKHLGPLKI